MATLTLAFSTKVDANHARRELREEAGVRVSNAYLVMLLPNETLAYAIDVTRYHSNGTSTTT